MSPPVVVEFRVPLASENDSMTHPHFRTTPHPTKQCKPEGCKNRSVTDTEALTTLESHRTDSPSRDPRNTLISMSVHGASSQPQGVADSDVNDPLDTESHATDNEQVTAADTQWLEICAEIRQDNQSVSLIQLESFQDCLERRERAAYNISQAFDHCQQGLETAVTGMIHNVAVPVHDTWQESLETLESDITRTLVSNHERRQQLLLALEASHAAWQMQYSSLVGKVLPQPPQVHPSSDIPDSCTTSCRELENPKAIVKHVDDGDKKEPNWTELAKYQPTRTNLELFLQGRDRWQHAHGRFAQALDEIYADLQSDNERILQTALDTHDSWQKTLDEQQHDIQLQLASNVVRRRELQRALQDSAKHTQGMFASLMARVMSCLPSQSDVSTDKASVNKKRKLECPARRSLTR
jgi:hypothetical protein